MLAEISRLSVVTDAELLRLAELRREELVLSRSTYFLPGEEFVDLICFSDASANACFLCMFCSNVPTFGTELDKELPLDARPAMDNGAVVI